MECFKEVIEVEVGFEWSSESLLKDFGDKRKIVCCQGTRYKRSSPGFLSMEVTVASFLSQSAIESE